MSAPKDRPLSSERERFLNLRNLPAQLSASETSHLLGFAPHDIPVLVSKGLLKPLGHPADSAPKYYALGTVQELTVQELKADVKWLHRARQMIYDHWRMKNAGRASAEYQMGKRTEDAAAQVA
jgi:hypothetical protein